MKINLDLSIHFWIGLVIFVASGISAGAIHLTNAVPESWIPYITAWAGILSVVGPGYLTGALALHNASPQAKLDVAAALPEVKGIVTNTQLAHDTVSPKVVATAAEIPTTVRPAA
jgi:hypothetical protein